jgi:hypothetical protein
MRLVCIHADTVDALKRLNIEFDDLTPQGLWSSAYHLVGLTVDQCDALEQFQVQVEDLTPAPLLNAADQDVRGAARTASAPPASPTAAAQAGASGAGQRQSADVSATSSDQAGRETPRAVTGAESEVPLAQGRDGGTRADGPEAKAEAKAEARPGAQAQATAQAQPQGASSRPQPAGVPKAGGGKGNAATPAQGARKGQPAPPTQGGQAAGSGQRYGTTRLRISVAGKYTEATVANGKIVVGGRSFDSPDQAAAELTKSRGDWTFWEYYDSADGKWRMLTRDWDTVLKSATPGGR